MSENISKQKRDALRDGIAEIRAFVEASGQNDDAKKHISTLIALEKELFEKKYGLVFERHSEGVDSIVGQTLPVLVEDESLALVGDGPVNAIVEGDNLVALDALSRSLKGKIDLIYIDPPYNTGTHDFRYDDSFVDRNDTFSHSKWLSFMEPRLRLARTVMKPDAAIFISIDDREQSDLKMLCDEVFGASCFVGCISWQKTYSPRNDALGIPTEVEYVLVYSRYPGWEPKRLVRTAEMDSRYSSHLDGDVRVWKSEDATAPGAATHHGMVYAIQHPITGDLIYPAVGRCWRFGQDQMLAIMQQWAPYHLEESRNAQRCADICGTTAQELEEEGLAKDIILDDATEATFAIAKRRYAKGAWPKLYFTDGGNGGIACKGYLDEKEGKVPTNLWLHSLAGHTDEAKKELKLLFEGAAPFDNPKPTRLIKRILEIGAPKDAIVLDFFAGSGTTGQAVSDKNAEDGGTRRYILCTNNEANICAEVTYPRCKKVLETPIKIEEYADIYSKELVLTHKDYENWKDYVEEAKEARKAARASGEFARISNPHIDSEGKLVVVGARVRDGVRRTGSLKYYRAESIPMDDSALYDVSDELLKHARALVELEYGIDFATTSTVAIALTEDEADGLFESDISQIETLYIGYDVLLTAEQMTAIEVAGIVVREVPSYYYREVGA